MYILATASNQMKPAEAGRAIAVMLAAISLRNCFASTSTPPGSEWAQLHEQMDPDPVVLRFSPDEWNKLASGLVFSPDDLSMIEAGLGALGKFSNPHRTDNIADALEDWAKKIGEPSQDSRAPQLMPSETDGSSGTRD
ncbi:MAG: hypothetical protein QOH31_69 [Verrucomicrobiota bacterium]